MSADATVSPMDPCRGRESTSQEAREQLPFRGGLCTELASWVEAFLASELPEGARRAEETSSRPIPDASKAVPPLPVAGTVPRATRFRTIERWVGRVLAMEDEFFIAALRSPLSEEETEEAEIPRDLVSEDDEELLAPGACFYMSTGYLESPGGQLNKSVRLRFQRLPRWEADEVIEAYKQGKELLKDLRCDQ